MSETNPSPGPGVPYFRGNTGMDLANELADLPDVLPFEDDLPEGHILSYTEGIIGLVSKQHPFAQLGIGMSTGWICGVVGRRVGTSVLFLLASGIIVLQLANHSGVVQVNWGRVGDAVTNACQGEQQQLVQTATQSIIHKLRINRLWQVMSKHSYLNTGLLSGVLLGLSL